MTSGNPPAITDQELQEELYRLEAYRNQLSAMLQQHQVLSSSRLEHVRARETLENLERLETGQELLVPIGGEAYVRGNATLTAPVLLGIGSGVVVEMDRPKAAQVIADRIVRIEKAAQDLEAQMRTLEERVQILSQQLDALTHSSGSGGLPEADDVGGN